MHNKWSSFTLLSVVSSLKANAAPIDNQARSIQFQTCGEPQGTVERVSIDPCVDDDCDIEPPNQYTVSIDYTPRVDVPAPQVGVFAQDSDDSDSEDNDGPTRKHERKTWKYGYSDDYLDACTMTNCPITGGTQSTLTYNLNTTVPEYNGDIDRFMLNITSESGENAICVTFNVDADSDDGRPSRRDHHTDSDTHFDTNNDNDSHNDTDNDTQTDTEGDGEDSDHDSSKNKKRSLKVKRHSFAKDDGYTTDDSYVQKKRFLKDSSKKKRSTGLKFKRAQYTDTDEHHKDKHPLKSASHESHGKNSQWGDWSDDDFDNAREYTNHHDN